VGEHPESRRSFGSKAFPPEQSRDDGALVPSARNELHARDVESLSPVRLVFENRLEHRFGLSRRVEELNHLMDLVRDDGVEDRGVRIRRRRREIFGLLGGLLPLFRRCNCHPPWPTIQY
jgi:hypothetical protein